MSVTLTLFNYKNNPFVPRDVKLFNEQRGMPINDK